MTEKLTVVSSATQIEKEVDMGRNLSLDSIMVLQIDQNANYMVTMFGLEPDNCEDRVLLSSGQKEMTLMKMCLLNNFLPFQVFGWVISTSLPHLRSDNFPVHS